MQDLRKIFRYARPYRRDLFAAVGLIFIECIFEMVIPVLMSTLVDDGVPTHNMAVIFRQGGLMILCAVLALITGCSMRGTPARFANGFAAELRMAEYAAVQKFDFANLDRFSDASLVTRMTTDVTGHAQRCQRRSAVRWCAARSCSAWGWRWPACSARG